LNALRPGALVATKNPSKSWLKKWWTATSITFW
jgi:hypothetical protein